MKTNTEKNSKSELQNRPEPLSTANPRQIDFQRRRANRSLDTARLLALLESDAPSFLNAAEIVGQWVWIEFEDKQPVNEQRLIPATATAATPRPIQRTQSMRPDLRPMRPEMRPTE